MDALAAAKLQEEATRFSTVIVSAYGDTANIRTAMNRGAFDFLTKPIDFTDFETTLRPEARESGHTLAYSGAFAKLEAQNPGALAAFAALVGGCPADALAQYHLRRLLNGGSGTRIEMA